jgi:hypothetical protein
MALFTFILEYDGYTMVRQARGRDSGAALEAWATSLAASRGRRLPKHRSEIAAGLQRDEPVKPKSIKDSWCFSASIGGAPALLTIVKTTV